MKRGLLFLLGALALAGPAQAGSGPVEVVVTLEAPPLARAVEQSRTLTAAVKARRLDLRAPMSSSYLRSLASAQRTLEARIEAEIPGARVRWRYRVVLNGLAVVVPADRVDDLARVPGVARVHTSVGYRVSLDRSPEQIGAPTLWGSDLSTAGAGMKIGIIDDGVDQTHPFFSAEGFALPAGFPKGNTSFTTAKVIVARAFPPATPAWRNASLPFDPEHSEHGTHVAGIAGGNRGVFPGAARGIISGIAPQAYIGNYKALTIPTPDFGLNGNSPELAAAIEAAVRDGMDVINLSLGEVEIEPSRDLVVQALDAAADAGVVAAVAAGNDFGEFGAGSVGSPGTAEKAITAAAVTTNRSGPADRLTGFSAAGPTPLSLRLKPDVAAPGSEILSSIPGGDWDRFGGTSMAAPHVAGAAALLLQRHPEWTPAQVKSALVLTGRALTEPATRAGGGRIDLVQANAPFLFASPTSLSFGLVRTGASATRGVELADAGGGAGEWAVTVAPDAANPFVALSAPASLSVPGRLDLAATVAANAPEADFSGYVVLQRGTDTRRIPYWLGVTAPSLPPGTELAKPGVYRGRTSGRLARVERYRYPALRDGAGVSARLAGPEHVFRVRIGRPVANFGVAILSRARGVRVEPRVVAAGDENRQVGYTSLPLNLNPYLDDFMTRRLVSGAVLPAAGVYNVVFDSPTRAGAGAFTFRFWIDDTTPPRLRVPTTAARRNGALAITATDAGAGVDPLSIRAEVDGVRRPARLSGGTILVTLRGLGPGRHRLALQVSDHQESRNTENVGRILPNTARVTASFTIR